jgi:uncharacterized membrane protein YesL
MKFDPPHNFRATLHRGFSWTWFDAQNVYLLFYLSSTSDLYTKMFNCLLICYLPLTYPGLWYFYSCGLTPVGCPVIEVSPI